MYLKLTMLLIIYSLLLAIAFEPAAATKAQKLIKNGLIGNPTTWHSQNVVYGCKFDDCSQDINYVLGNLTNNSVISIKDNVVLSSNITLTKLINISIIGYNNPVITCYNGTGIHISFSHNCMIEGITWNGCGTQYFSSYKDPEIQINPGICFQYSSNITVKDCFFKYSKGQALALLNVSGDVNIYQCKFVGCSSDGGHGAALYYSSSNPKLKFTIDNCEFNYNTGIISGLYLGKSATYVALKNCTFHENKGTPIYISNKGLNIHKQLIFEGNSAANGGGIVVGNHTIITFCKNSTATFYNNFASKCGGAIFVGSHAKVLFNETTKVTFRYNRAYS